MAEAVGSSEEDEDIVHIHMKVCKYYRIGIV